MAAIALVALAAIATAQVLVVCARQRLVGEQRLAAQLEAANVQERIAALPDEAISASTLESFRLAPSHAGDFAARQFAHRRGRLERATSQDRSEFVSKFPGRSLPATADAEFDQRRTAAARRINGLAISRHRGGRTMKPFRRGYTLVEMMLAITLTSIVLATVGVMLHGVFRVQRTMSDHTQFIDHLSRLAEQFRNDVHQVQVGRAGGSIVCRVVSRWKAD